MARRVGPEDDSAPPSRLGRGLVAAAIGVGLALAPLVAYRDGVFHVPHLLIGFAEVAGAVLIGGGAGYARRSSPLVTILSVVGALVTIGILALVVALKNFAW